MADTVAASTPGLIVTILISNGLPPACLYCATTAFIAVLNESIAEDTILEVLATVTAEDKARVVDVNKLSIAALLESEV